MIKLPENKTRKRLRLTLCVLYLFEIIFCTMPYLQGYDSSGNLATYSVIDMLSYLGGELPETADGSAFQTYTIFMFVFFIIPIVGFLFCAFDKQRNLKNIVSVICCLLGVLSILALVSYGLSLGSLLALLVYLVICFLTTLSMFARITDKEENQK
ncbi:MAG: hypothetical protein LUF33_03595 [Clostridiales bacterium]|nr:hypothetical protein [Clostridiales bacterium]